jgi:hypothetical protein
MSRPLLHSVADAMAQIDQIIKAARATDAHTRPSTSAYSRAARELPLSCVDAVAQSEIISTNSQINLDRPPCC